MVHSWSRRKHHYLERYAQIFSVGMKKWERRTYIDLFAGPGRCYEEESGDFYDGSPLIALQHDFTDHIYVELNSDSADALRTRCAAVAPGRRPAVIEGDCNDRIGQVIRAMPSQGVTLAFVDPTSWQIGFRTIEALTKGRRVDLMVSFFAGMMKRVVHYEQPKLDAFFGTDEWRDQRYMDSDGQPSLAGLLGCYREQLEKIGYHNALSAREIEVKNSKNATMYLMAFFSKHPLGYKFWDEVTTQDERGQLAIKW